MGKPTNDIMMILRAGGSVSIEARKPTNDLMMMARVAAEAGGTLILRDIQKPTNDLMMLARAGGKNVILEIS